MCDCCKKIIVQTTNNVNTTSVGFVSVTDTNVVKTTGYNFNYTAPTDGDYILQLELNVTFSNITAGANDLTSQLIKNNILQTNTNGSHRTDLGFELKNDYDTMVTHNCKITGVTAGNTIGFKLSVSDSTVSIINGSITAIKL